MYKCIIIDDEPHAIEGLKKYIKNITQLIVVNHFTDPGVALQHIMKSDPVDLIFLDVDMPTISGIELAGLIREKTLKLIFTTAHTKYAFQAFEVKADAYLLKPYSLAKFISTIQYMFPTNYEEESKDEKYQDNDDFFFIKSKEDNKIIKIRYNDIVAIESKLNYVLVLTINKSVLTYMSLTEMSNKLKPYMGFIQLHRSFIVNTKYITSIEGNTMTMDNGMKFTIGDYYRKDFNEYISSKLIKVKRKN